MTSLLDFKQNKHGRPDLGFYQEDAVDPPVSFSFSSIGVCSSSIDHSSVKFFRYFRLCYFLFYCTNNKNYKLDKIR